MANRSPQIGELERAFHHLQEAAQLDPNDCETLVKLGSMAERLGLFQEAKDAYQREIELQRESAIGYAPLGYLYSQLGQSQSAREIWHKGLSCRPQDGTLQLYLAQLDLSEGNYGGAAVGYAQYLQSHPQHLEVQINFALALRWSGQVSAAQGILEELAKAHPTQLLVRQNLADCYRVTLSAALARGEHLPAFAESPLASQSLASALNTLGRIELAFQVLENASKRWPEDPVLFVEYKLWAPVIYARSGEAETTAIRCLEGIDEIERAWTNGRLQTRLLLQVFDHRNPFELAYQGQPNVAFFGKYGRLHTQLAQSPLDRSAKSTEGRRIRIGYISSLFCNHTVTKLTGGFISQIDRTKFEAFAYYTGFKFDRFTESVRDRVEHFTHIYDEPEAIAARVRKDNLDVLVFPDIAMEASSNALAARRMAPIQATTFCHPITTGYPSIDYFVSVDRWEHENAQEHYHEILERLPSYGVYFEPPPAEPPLARQDLGLPTHGPIFCSPMSLFKYLPEYDCFYCKILQHLQDATLVFLEGEFPYVAQRFEQRLRDACSTLGFDPGPRLRFVPKLPRTQFAQLLGASDVLLDSMPFSSFTTVMEAWAQSPTPLIAAENPLMRGRTAAATLRTMGLPELIADNPDQFVARAVELGRSATLREAMKSRLKEATKALWYDSAPVRALERHFQKWVKDASS